MKRLSFTRTPSSQRGFSAHAAITLLLVVGVLGATGYLVYQRSNRDTTPQSVVLQPDVPATIKTKADLEQTSAAISKADNQLSSQLDTSSLAASIKKLQ